MMTQLVIAKQSRSRDVHQLQRAVFAEALPTDGSVITCEINESQRR